MKLSEDSIVAIAVAFILCMYFSVTAFAPVNDDKLTERFQACMHKTGDVPEIHRAEIIRACTEFAERKDRT